MTKQKYCEQMLETTNEIFFSKKVHKKVCRKFGLFKIMCYQYRDKKHG